MLCLSTFLSTTVTGGSARIDRLGMTISGLSGSSSWTDRQAPLSHAISRSLMPRATKAVAAPRAPESSTLVLA